MARTKDPKLAEARRLLIADTTIELLTEASWRSVTLTAVAERAGISKGVVTYWYATKDALMLAAIERFHGRYEERLMSVATAEAPSKERLRLLIEVAFPDRQTLRDELAFQTELWSYAKGRPDVMARIQAAYGTFRMATQALIELGVADGYVTTSERDALHLFVHSLIDGLSIHLAFDDIADVPAARDRLQTLLERWFESPA